MRSRPLPVAAAAWGVAGVVAFLASAIVRLVPIALEALAFDLELAELGALAGSLGTLGYVEGYRGFQKRFSPRVVARALTLLGGASSSWRRLLAPLFCMGLFAATRKRLITSWGTVLGVTGLVLSVSRLSQPWRGIIDAGVVVGLSWGVLSILVYALRAALGRPMPVDPDLAD